MIDDTIRGNYEDLYKKYVLDQVKQYGVWCEQTDDLIVKRKHKQLDYDAIKGKMKNNSLDAEVSSKDFKSPRIYLQDRAKFQEKKDIYETLNDILIEGIPALLGLHSIFFEAALEVFFEIQMRYYYQMALALDRIEKCLTKNLVEYSKESADQTVSMSIMKIKSLSICH